MATNASKVAANVVPLHGRNQANAPPYVAYEMVKESLVEYSRRTLPAILSPRRDLALQPVPASQVNSAFRFLGLTDGQNRSTNAMCDAVKVIKTDRWPPSLERIIRAAYSQLLDAIELDGRSADFVTIFSKIYPGKPEMVRKARAFFLRAAQEAGLSIGDQFAGLIRVRSRRKVADINESESVKRRSVSGGRTTSDPQSYSGLEMIEVILNDGTILRAPEGIEPEKLRKLLAAIRM